MFSSLRSLRPRLLLPIAALCLAGPAVAQPRIEDEREAVRRELEESRARVKKLEERLRRLEARRTESSAAPAVVRIESTCGTPFFLDQDGVKHFRPECLLAAARRACETNPFSIDDQGIKRIRPACGG